MSAEPFSIRQHHRLVMTAPGGTIQYNGPPYKRNPHYKDETVMAPP